MVWAIESKFSALSFHLAEFIPAGENCNAELFGNGIDPQWLGQGEVAALTGPVGSTPWNDGLFQELNQGVIGITVLLA